MRLKLIIYRPTIGIPDNRVKFRNSEAASFATEPRSVYFRIVRFVFVGILAQAQIRLTAYLEYGVNNSYPQ